MSRIFPPEVLAFFEVNNQGRSAKDMADLLNATFGTSYTVNQIKGCRARMHWNSGLTGHFEKGHTPYNKGKKGHKYPGMELTQFKAGHRPHNAHPVGTELVNTDGYLARKVAEPNKWRHVHILNWEAAHGPVPEGHVVIFKDQNRSNCTLDNLLLVSRAELAIMNKRRLVVEDPDGTETGLYIARLIQAKRKKQKKRGLTR